MQGWKWEENDDITSPKSGADIRFTVALRPPKVAKTRAKSTFDPARPHRKASGRGVPPVFTRLWGRGGEAKEGRESPIVGEAGWRIYILVRCVSIALKVSRCKNDCANTYKISK